MRRLFYFSFLRDAEPAPAALPATAQLSPHPLPRRTRQTSPEVRYLAALTPAHLLHRTGMSSPPQALPSSYASRRCAAPMQPRRARRHHLLLSRRPRQWSRPRCLRPPPLAQPYPAWTRLLRAGTPGIHSSSARADPAKCRLDFRRPPTSLPFRLGSM